MPRDRLRINCIDIIKVTKVKQCIGLVMKVDELMIQDGRLGLSVPESFAVEQLHHILERLLPVIHNSGDLDYVFERSFHYGCYEGQARP